MSVKAKNEGELDQRCMGYTAITSMTPDLTIISFEELSRKIVANGGRVTDALEEPKLTHVVLDKRDTSRRAELVKRTSK